MVSYDFLWFSNNSLMWVSTMYSPYGLPFVDLQHWHVHMQSCESIGARHRCWANRWGNWFASGILKTISVKQTWGAQMYQTVNSTPSCKTIRGMRCGCEMCWGRMAPSYEHPDLSKQHFLQHICAEHRPVIPNAKCWTPPSVLLPCRVGRSKGPHIVSTWFAFSTPMRFCKNWGIQPGRWNTNCPTPGKC